MRVVYLVSTVMLVLSELSLLSAKAILHIPRHHRSHALQQDLDRDAMESLRRRQTSSGTIQTPPVGDTNITISNACINKLSQLTRINNQAGMAACFNVLQINSKSFQADLRLYQMQQASGPFAGIASEQMLVHLAFPPSTKFNLLMKRQMNSMHELQQYSLQGSFLQNMDMSKLNDTELMSLSVPAIQINAVDPKTQKAIRTNVTIADTAYFVVGAFKDNFVPSLVNPSFQAAAIALSSPFVLPGVTLGIFPTGLIVTSAWLLLFIIAYGVGTFGRIQHRTVYRRRKAAIVGRTGKRI